jgi:hypothetical protein
MMLYKANSSSIQANNCPQSPIWIKIFRFYPFSSVKSHFFFFIFSNPSPLIFYNFKEKRWIKEMFYKRITWRNNWKCQYTTSEEMFQNEVLRPILKLQNDLFIASFKNYSAKYIKINSQTTEKKLNQKMRFKRQ